MNIAEEIEMTKEIIKQHKAQFSVSRDIIKYQKSKLKKLESVAVEYEKILSPRPVPQ